MRISSINTRAWAALGCFGIALIAFRLYFPIPDGEVAPTTGNRPARLTVGEQLELPIFPPLFLTAQFKSGERIRVVAEKVPDEQRYDGKAWKAKVEQKPKYGFADEIEDYAVRVAEASSGDPSKRLPSDSVNSVRRVVLDIEMIDHPVFVGVTKSRIARTDVGWEIYIAVAVKPRVPLGLNEL